MKTKLILLTLTLFLPLAAWSQNQTHSQPVFEGKVIPKARMYETYISGDVNSENHITLFHSVRFDAVRDEVRRTTNLILEDANDAVSKEMEIAQGDLTYALLVLPPSGSLNRFLGFQAKPSGKDGTCSVIVVYLEGYTTINQLKKNYFKGK